MGGEVLLVVGNYPTRDSDAAGVPFSGETEVAVRGEIARLWKGKVVYTYAVRCAAGKTEVSDRMIEECRGYLTHLVDQVKPARILALGTVAYWGLTGRKVSPVNIRRGYTYLSTETPVYPLIPMGMMARNRFRYDHFVEDLDYALTSTPPLPPWDAPYHLIETPEDAEEAVAELERYPSVTYDVEHSGPTHTEYFRVDTLSMAPTGHDKVWVWDEKALLRPGCVVPLRRVLENAEIEKVGQGVKVDITAVEEDPNINARFAGPVGDTLVWRKLDDPDVLGRLEYQSEMVGMGGHKEAMALALKDAVKTVEKTREEYDSDHLALPGMIFRPLEAAVHYKGLDPLSFAYGCVASTLRSQYCALDTVSTSRLAARIRPRVEESENLSRSWNILLKKGPETVSHIERWGFRADRRQIENVGRYVDGEMAKLQPKLEAHGVDFKLTQDTKLAEFLYEKLGLPVLKLTKPKNGQPGNPSVGAPALEKLKGRHPVVELILAYKEYETIGSRYAWGLMDHVRADGRIHCRFNLTGAKTGRWSSSDPNMQNIPSRNPLISKMVKNIFTAAPGYTLVQLDYAQQEYRVASLLSGDQVMQQVFRDKLDLHRRTAEMISMDAWGITQSVMEGYTTAEMKPYRFDAKRVNFGTLYGLGATTLAADLGISVNKAKKLIHLIMGQFTDLAAWIEDITRFCRRHGYVHTYFDGLPARWRPLWNIADIDDSAAAGARNAAINTPVQGTSADYMLRSLVEVVDLILSDGIPARVVGTVHDSMMLEIRNDWVEELTEMCVDIMQSWWCGDVPLVADVEKGVKWGGMTEVKKDDDGVILWNAA